MKKTLFMGLIAGIITIAMIPAMTLSVTNAFATSSQCDDPPCNGWGQAAKNPIEATGGREFGEHASNPDPDHEDTPRGEPC